MRKKSNKSSMRKQNSIILAGFIISVLFSGCGIKKPLTQKPVEEITQKQRDNAKSSVKTAQKPNAPAQQLQEN
jgi:hypothetical protein